MGRQMEKALTHFIMIILNKSFYHLFFLYFLPFILIGVQSCYHANEKFQTIKIDSVTWAEGKTIKDSVFEGVVKYHSMNNRIIKQVNYKNGVIEGPCIEFYPNGSISEKYNILQGEYNGQVYIYDTSGNIQREDFYYYGLRMGGSLSYENKKLTEYSFYSLENKCIFEIKYDSIMYKKISELESKFIFINENDYQIYDSLNLSTLKRECFMYILSPPAFKFQYDLVVVDSIFKVKTKLRSFSGKFPWTKFEIPNLVLDNKESIAIELTVQDTNMIIGDAHMFKKI